MSETKNDRNSDSYLKSLPKQEKLSPEQIEDLMRATVYGQFGYGVDRKELLGDWYDVIQWAVNMQMESIGRQCYMIDTGFVLDKIGELGALQQIAEEASELAQAILKYIRFIDGDNPVYINGVKADNGSNVDAQCLLDKIEEELSDVVLACDVVNFRPNHSVIRERLSMWRARLEESSND